MYVEHVRAEGRGSGPSMGWIGSAVWVSSHHIFTIVKTCSILHCFVRSASAELKLTLYFIGLPWSYWQIRLGNVECTVCLHWKVV